MNLIDVKFNDLQDQWLKSPSFYGKAARGAIIRISKDEFEKKLKHKKNLNGEPIYLPVKTIEIKEQKHEEQDEKTE